MKLRKDERFTAYVIMLEEIKEQEFLCNCFDNIFFDTYEETEHRISYNERMFMETLPKLYSKKSVKTYSANVWFNRYDGGERERIKLLQQCIQETSDF
jgi:hypothetical protein